MSLWRKREREKKLGARNSCHGVASSLCPRERNLIHFLVEYAYIREKAFPTNVESTHVTHKEMILIQKDTQFLGLGKNHETTEVAAVEKQNGICTRQRRWKKDKRSQGDRRFWSLLQ